MFKKQKFEIEYLMKEKEDGLKGRSKALQSITSVSEWAYDQISKASMQRINTNPNERSFAFLKIDFTFVNQTTSKLTSKAIDYKGKQRSTEL